LGEVAVTGLTAVGTDRTNPKIFLLNNYQAGDSLFVTHGRQNLKLGGSYDRFQDNGTSESRSRGQLRFRSLADLLRFKVWDLQGATIDSDFDRGNRQSLAGAFIQDDFQVNHRLTLNGGVRYEYVSTPTEVNGKVGNLRNILDDNVTLGDPFFQPLHHTVAPRVGFALDVSGNGKTVVRSGFGVYYDQPLFQVYRLPAYRSLPYVNLGRLTNVTALPVDPAEFKGVDTSTESIQFDFRPTYAMHYNFNVQRELAGMVLSLSYVGSRGVNLIANSDTNTAYPQILSDGREYFPAGSSRRNPNFGQVRTILQGFDSNYNSLTAGVLQRFHRGLQYQLSYTYGKSIDDASGQDRLEFSNGQAYVFDPYNRLLNRGRSDFDTRHTFTANTSYDLPIGESLKGVARQILHGWQLNAIVMMASGVPFTPLVDGDPDRDGSDGNAARPNLLPGVSLIPSGGSTPDFWFNPAAFAPPEVGFRGTAGRNILNGPDFRTLDVGVVKNFRISETCSVQFRTEFFNLFNRANFSMPSNSENGELIYSYTPAAGGKPARFSQAGSVGEIFSTVGDSREIQFALKFVF
ncbi:MAG TPA: hypothetical protein VMW38_18550, partial [Terriglobia bacterium]|nr:hypothetical protein [Terriglobia bacterium]